jgi:hypothetical protein
MSDYRTVDKTGWFIQKMMSAWFSRPELVDLAEREFPAIPRKTLDGTIGQYWSDSVNPKWGTYKAIQSRGLRAIESEGRRRIIGNEISQALSAPVNNAKPTESQLTEAIKTTSAYGGESTRGLWTHYDEELWQKALARYWTFVKPSHLALEKEMDQLDAEQVKKMDLAAWYKFLLEKYFRWKYTAPNRFASTTKSLRSYAENNELASLHAVKEKLFALNKDNIQQCLAVASSIRGLGTAGASGLLAVLFPTQFGTVDQFAVKALAGIPELPERSQVAMMNPESLKLSEGALLIRIMQRKAEELNQAFSTTFWTPRKVDMVLWTCAR